MEGRAGAIGSTPVTLRQSVAPLRLHSTPPDPSMRLPNLLATGKGRLAAFFFLYVTEGIPLGFAATAVGAQRRPPDGGPAASGAVVGWF